jgi:hypothetical protein
VSQRPKTVGELIAVLSEHDPELRVLVDGYEDGMDPLIAYHTRAVPSDTGWWSGEYEAVRDEVEP